MNQRAKLALDSWILNGIMNSLQLLAFIWSSTGHGNKNGVVHFQSDVGHF
jgi:hypothetical protein